MNELEKSLEKWLERLESDYLWKTPRSRELYERAKKFLPSGVTYALRHYGPYPAYITRAKGTRVWDVDGNEYLDLWMGHGAHLLGHLPDVVVEALREVSRIGTHFGFEHPYVVEYVELLSKVIPGLEFIRFTNSGTEANMYAIKLSRAYTRRKHIVKIEGGWHGAYDPLQVAITYPYTEFESAGLIDEVVKYTVAVPFNDLEALEKALRAYEPAAVILEPVMGAGGCVEPVQGYLRGVKELTEKYGSLLIFDEVITGFRLAPGGAQEYYGVKADLVVFGKALSGGVGSIGAFAGRGEILELVNHVKYPEPSLRVQHAGTYSANVASVVAGYAVVKYLAEHRTLYEESNAVWSYFRRKVVELCSENGISCWSTGDASLTGLHFTTRKPLNAREVHELRWSRLVEKALHMYSRLHGILYMSEKTPHFLPALTTSRVEVEHFINVISEFLKELARMRSTAK